MKKVIVLIIALVSVNATAAFSAEYFVATNGSDSASGTKSSPWKTISNANKTVKAGDVVNVFPGVYDEQVTVTVSGEKDKLITFQSAESRKAKMQGFDLKGDYIRVKGFEITYGKTNETDIGVFAGIAHRQKTANKGCEILDNYIHDIEDYGIVAGTDAKVRDNKLQRVRAGIYVNSFSLVENNEIDTLIYTGRAGDKIKGKYTFFVGENITFRGNYFHGSAMETMASQGVCFFGTWDQSEGPSSNILIENNRCFNSTHASEPEGSRQKSHHITYRNNLFVNTVYVGLLPKDWTDVTIVNNTFINCGAYPIWFQTARACENAVVKNNLISYYKHKPIGKNPPAESGIAVWLDKTGNKIPEISNNLMWNCKNRNYNPTDITAEPIFVDPDNNDFHLKAGSPGIDNGADLKDLVPIDIEGNKRPQGKGYDIGAFEYTIPR